MHLTNPSPSHEDETPSIVKDIYNLNTKVLEQSKLLLEVKSFVEQILGKLHGDIIESGGTKTVNIYNYDSSKSHYPDMVHEPAQTLLPQQLQSPRAQQMQDRLVQAGLLDQMWQPTKLSGTQCSLLAKAICDRLGINDVWQIFGFLWKKKPESLRRSFYKALEQKKSIAFQDKLKTIID